MQQQSNMQNKFLIDADIGDDDVTLPNLPAVDVPIIEPPVKQEVKAEEVVEAAPSKQN
jgi:fused signal recognition particle receptor